MNKLALSVDEAAEAAGVGRDLVYRAINDGSLKTAKIGKRRLIRIADLDSWLDLAVTRTTEAMGFTGEAA